MLRAVIQFGKVSDEMCNLLRNLRQCMLPCFLMELLCFEASLFAEGFQGAGVMT